MTNEMSPVARLAADVAVAVREDLEYRTAPSLKLDVYAPESAGTDRLPAIFFVHGDGPPEYLEGIKSSAQYVSWGRIAAAHDLVGISFDHRSTHGWTRIGEPIDDVARAIAWVRAHSDELRVDPDRIAVWCCSAGPPVAFAGLLPQVPECVRCLAVYYGVMDLEPAAERVDDPELEEDLRAASPLEVLRRLSGKVPPLFVARGGKDNPRLNEGLDRFVAAALELNVPLELHNHPEGDHGFEVRTDDGRSIEIVERTIEFVRRHTLAHGS